MVVIFVATAYFGDPERRGDTAGRPYAGRCISLQPGVEAIVPCQSAHDAVVVADVALTDPCPRGTARHQLTGRSRVLCLSPPATGGP